MHNAIVSRLGLGTSFAASFVLICCLREFPLSAIANRFEMACQSKATDAIVTKSAIVVRESKRSTINTNLNLILYIIKDVLCPKKPPKQPEINKRIKAF